MARTVLGSGDASTARWSRAGSSLSADSEIPFENRLRFSTIFYLAGGSRERTSFVMPLCGKQKERTNRFMRCAPHKMLPAIGLLLAYGEVDVSFYDTMRTSFASQKMYCTACKMLTFSKPYSSNNSMSV